MFGSDIRSMINFIQANYNNSCLQIKIINNSVWNKLFTKLIQNEPPKQIYSLIHKIKIEYSLDNRNIIIQLIQFIIRNKSKFVSSDLLLFCENILHSNVSHLDCAIHYSIHKLPSILNKDCS